MEDSVKKNVLIYVSFVAAYGLSVFFAFTGCALFYQRQLVSILFSSFPMYPFVALQLFSLSIPLLFFLSLNILFYARSYGSITPSSQRMVLIAVVGITLLLHFIVILLQIMFPSWMAYSNLFIYLLAVGLYSSVSLFIFLIIITSLAAEKPSQFALNILSQSRLWAAFILILFLLILSMFPVIAAQTIESLLPQTYDETLRRSIVSGLFALPVALVLPLFPWAFEYFGSRHRTH